MPINGLVTMTPTSIASTGTGNSSSINTNGSVTFSSCATLSLNGVFTSSYDNYMIIVRWVSTASTVTGYLRFRASGTDNSTASSYVAQKLATVGGSTLSAARTTSNQAECFATSNDQRDGATFFVFGPQLAQETAFRCTVVNSNGSACLFDFAGTHNQTTSYDGITFICGANAVTGLITVYGFNQ